MLQERHPLMGKEVSLVRPVPFTFRAAEDCARFSLRIDPASASAASQSFGIKLPTKVGELAFTGTKLALCLGPDEWFLIAPLSDQQAVEAAFAELYKTTIHSLVDIGHREVGIELIGRDAVLALQSAIAFDVEKMPVGTGCRTIFDKAQIVLIREAEDRFRIECWRTFADHVWGILHCASREIELEI